MIAPEATGRKNFSLPGKSVRSLYDRKSEKYRGVEHACICLDDTQVPHCAVFSIPGVAGKKGPRLIRWRLRESEFVKYFENFLLRFAEAPG